VDKIYNEARRCYDNHLDESAWVKVVNNVLEATHLCDNESLLRVESIQTQAIDRAFLPLHVSQSLAKKADLALAFSADNVEVAAVLQSLSKTHSGIPLSQMTDAYTSTVPLVCGIEVKERGGDYNEAIVQLAIWCAAGLERLRGLREIGQNHTLQPQTAFIRETRGETQDETQTRGRERTTFEDDGLLPFLGWTVIGHDWKLHISWKDSSGNVVSCLVCSYKMITKANLCLEKTVLGPWRLLNAGTSSHFEILSLLVLVHNVKKWLEQDYWLWLREEVLDRLR
jgi:hypothetical protein